MDLEVEVTQIHVLLKAWFHEVKLELWLLVHPNLSHLYFSCHYPMEDKEGRTQPKNLNENMLNKYNLTHKKINQTDTASEI